MTPPRADILASVRAALARGEYLEAYDLAGAIAGHWLAAAAGAAHELAHRVEAAQQTLTWASAQQP